MKIAEAARWAPTGANAQCWDLIVIDDKKARQNVLDVFLRQSQRLVDHAKGFPAVKKTYLANTVAILVVLGDPRFKLSQFRVQSKVPSNTGGAIYCALFIVSWTFCWWSFSSAAFNGTSLTVSLSILPVKRNGGW